MRRFVPSPAGLALIALIVALAAVAWWRPFGGAVRLSVEVPAALALAPDARAVSLPVLLHLDNVSARAITLEASDCRLFRWLILTEQTQFVQSQQGAACAEADALQLRLAARTRYSELQQLVLQPTRYQLHQTYRVRVRFWGLEREARFQLTPAQLR